jgi:hypothetical protein
MFYFILIYLSSYIVYGNELIVNLEYGENNTFIFSYNLTTNYSYYLTFRLFEHEQIEFGLFSPKYQENSFQIYNQYDSSTTLFYLFIICFHFIRRLNDIDIQCKDIRLLKETDQNKSHIPSYKPLFIPMMYALSVLMLLPVIIQHRRRKKALLVQRQTQLRRLSLTISQDNPDILSKIVENGKINFKKIPIQIELVSLPSTKTIFDDIDDNDNVTFSLQNQPLINEHDDESGVTADDCIAHLLNNTPWNSCSTPQPLIETDSMDILKEQYVPMITTFDDNEDDQQPILKSDIHCTLDLFRTNPTFIESDV